MWDLIVSVPDHCLSFYSVFRLSDNSFEGFVVQILLLSVIISGCID